MDMKMKLMLAAGSLAVAAEALTLSVTNVTIAQRYPWNGLVDIDYTITCDDANADVWVYPVGYDADFNTSVAPRTLTGDGANGQPVKAGTHRMTWNMAADMPANYNRAKFSMKMHAYAGAAPYMVIDLSAGPDAEKYTVSYLTEIPGGEWSDEYKTTNLVLKLVVPGTFMMGSPRDEVGRSSDEPLHQVTLTQPFYMGIFELTQAQYNLVMGSNPSNLKGDSRPVEKVSYDDIRGSTLGAAWPANRHVDATSFMGKLRLRTGLTFDLPTEAQWEYTCRAGTGSALNNGLNITNKVKSAQLDDIARYGDGISVAVGSYRPNAWGFYDMHGNVAEWCLDWYGALSSSPVTDPVGATAGGLEYQFRYRLVKGGGYYLYNRGTLINPNYDDTGVGSAASCRSACRRTYFYVSPYDSSRYTYPDDVFAWVGFRVACFPAE